MGVFSELCVFENNEINAFCDQVFQKYGVDNLFVCGSIAQIFSGSKKGHQPKDVDLVTASEFIFEKIKKTIDLDFPNLRVVKSKQRCIIYSPHIVVEIWKRNRTVFGDLKAQLYNNRIPYLIN